MKYTSFIKSDFITKGIEEILKAPPDVLLGVDQKITQTLNLLRIQTVFDLALSTLFNNAAQIFANSQDVGSNYRKFGRAPSSMIDKDLLTTEAVTSLPYDELRAMIGIGPGNAPQLTSQLSIKTIRDLALWPPFLAAKAIVVEAYNPDLPGQEDPESPKELVPASGEFGTERHLYSSVVMFPGKYDESIDLNNTLFDITATGLIGFKRMRFGARITFSQTWFPKFVAKGQLLHSLPLGPGESTNIAVIDWTNKSKAATEQQISESERLSSTNDRARAIGQISKSVANDFQSGSSESFTQSASGSGGVASILPSPIGIGVGSSSISINESTGATHTVSTGTRNVATSLQQNIVDSTQQNSSAVRAQRAAVVSEISQSDSRNFSTRNITNYNHMHALTLQYYEVVQIYETQVRQEDAERCIFIPMALFDFFDERIVFKYLSTLKRAALNQNTRTLLRQLEDNMYGYTLHWGFDRIQLTFPDLIRPVLNSLLNSYQSLDNHGFLKVKFRLDNTRDAIQSDLQLNYLLQLNNVVVIRSRIQAPRSLVSGVKVELEDGTSITLNTPSVSVAGDPSVVNSALGGKPLSFGRIRRMSLVTSSYNANSIQDSVIHVLLAVKLNGESRFIDASFIMRPSQNYSNDTLFSIDGLQDMQLLEAELMEHQLYYSQQIWLQENPQNLIMQFAPLQLQIGGEQINLVDYITPAPIKVVGNYLVYRFTYEKDGEWKAWVKEHIDRSKVVSDQVAIPTGGVFAEAVLGRFNAAEKLDITRFSNWNDSPPPVKPPAIAPLSFTEPALPQPPQQATFSQPLVSIQTPIALPSPTGMTAVLENLIKGASFPDVSGAAETGDSTGKATELASQNSLAALQASGAMLTQLFSSMSKVLETAVSKDATKTLSDVGAVLNRKEQKEPTDKTKSESKGSSPESGNGDESSTDKAKDAEANVLNRAIEGSRLAQLAAAAQDDTATDAITINGIQTVDGDQALLNSTLITDPMFGDVYDFLILLQVIPDDHLLAVMEKRFNNLDKSVNVLEKYNELLNAFNARSGQLVDADRILFALRFQKDSVLPNTSTLDANLIKRLLEEAVNRMANRSFNIARRVNKGNDAKEIMRHIFTISQSLGLYDINQIAYILATAYHESHMGTFMTEIANGVSTDTIFTKDEYFFEPNPSGKNSYNGVNGNLKAGDQLKNNGVINTPADVTLWNGTVYPDSQPSAVKQAARDCDFYRFIGRGLVQITGRTPYQRYSNKPEYGNRDFLANPQEVSEIDVAARILVTGMVGGDFRAHKLSDYVSAAGYKAVEARDIVNGDGATHGKRIRDLAEEFKNSLIIQSLLDESAPIL